MRALFRSVWPVALFSASRVRTLSATLEFERYLFATYDKLVLASRQSSASVLRILDERLRECDRSIDATLVLVPAGNDLICSYAGGSRYEHFRHLRLARDDDALPALAAREGRHALSGGSYLFPTDRCAVAVPLVVGTSVRAVAYAASSGGEVDVPRVVRIAETAATPFTLAVERESDRSDAIHDGLTGLLAPRPFRRRLHEEIARVAATSPDTIVSLWFVDTDGFKNVNDRLGHRAGDAVLQTVARLLEAHLQPGTDVAARNGGDEFCAMIRNATKTAAVARAQRFCEAVRRHDFGIAMPVTASVGVASYPHDASHSNALLEAADAAMYCSKRAGRDRVTEAGAGAPVSRSSGQWASSHAASASPPA